jgi:hypothetical protein
MVQGTDVTDENFTDVRVSEWVNSSHFTDTVNRAVEKKSATLLRTISKLREQIEQATELYEEKKSARRGRSPGHHHHHHSVGHSHHEHYAGHHEHSHHHHGGHSYHHGEHSAAHRCSMSGALKSIIASFADQPKSSVSRRSIMSAARRQFNAAACKLELSKSACRGGRSGGSRRRSPPRKSRHSMKRRSASRRRSLRRSVRKSCGRKRSVSRKCSVKKYPKYYYDYSACDGGQVQYQYEPSQVAQVAPVLHSVPAVQLAATVNAKK